MTGGSGTAARDDRAREGVDHLQRAAKELIEAARAFLDVAEEVVDDPSQVASALGALGEMAEKVTSRRGGSGDDGGGADVSDRVQRIRIS